MNVSPTTILTTARAAFATLAVDIGGTTLKGAIFGLDGSVRHQKQVGTFAAGPDPLLALTALIEELQGAADEDGWTLLGIGLASPGVIDADRGRVVYASNLGWNELALAECLARRFSLPVRVEHDARAGAIAEIAARGDDSRYRDFVFVPIGTGVSAALVLDRRVIHGATWGAGEFGHMPVVASGESCSCGGFGCIEAYSSATTVMKRYRARGGIAANSTPELVSLLPTDHVAERVWRDLVDALAVGLSSLCAVIDPARIVIGGGLSLAGDVLLKPLRAAMIERLPWRETPPLVQSGLGSHAGLIGAALRTLPFTEHSRQRFALTAADELRTAAHPRESSSTLP
ncbi:ROK family protein [Microbacterium sp. EST19A]|uniref:ROK family protein n=1 Tax=Microbacterium sp. EST19A TaxID=2862681 RepID=UPI001CBDC05E|nr:ROK family protein [Microbacterium sp. EST19A]